MFDLGMQELIVIFIVALLVFGPKKLPELSRGLGKGIRELKMALRGVKDTIDEAEAQIEESASLDAQTGMSEKKKKSESREEIKTEQDTYKQIGEEDKEKADNG